MSPDLKLTYRILLAMLAVAEALALTGIVSAPHSLFLSELDIGNVGTYALFAVVLYAFSRPVRAEAAKVLAGGMVLALIAVFVESRKPLDRPFVDWIFVAALGFGAAAVVAWLARLKRREADARLTKDLLAASGIAPLADPTISAYLHLTQALHPTTFDLGAYRFDALLGFQPSAVLGQLAGHAPLLTGILFFAYHFQPYGISLLYAYQRSTQPGRPFSIIAFQAASALLSALLLYHLYPVAGPTYAFGAAFPGALPDAQALQNVNSLVARGARNGVPSMHFAWALALWLNARCLGVRWVTMLFAAWLVLTVMSTLGMGEHYLVDLAVAVPLVVGVQALCMFGVPWSRERVRAARVGLGLALAWILVLRLAPAAVVAVPYLGWMLMLATVVTSAAVYRPIEQIARAGAMASARNAEPLLQTETRQEVRLAAILFLVSGFAALVYQVLFSKALALTFGSQSTATHTVLAVYMCGMALGAWLGGNLAVRRADPLKLYAWCELGIGIYCAATPLIFQGIQALYVAVAGGVAPDASMLTVFRVGLGIAALLVPTVLMGATLPILARFFEGRAVSLGVSVALLYGANTIGAAAGALLAGYLVIPTLGIWKTTLAAAGLNFLVVWLALRLRRRVRFRETDLAGEGAASRETPGTGAAPRRLGYIALAVLGASGFVTLALEVNYIHLLTVVAGNSVYAFSLMLFTFLLGLGAGAEGARRLLQAGLALPFALAGLAFALAAVILAGVFLWEALPGYFASFESYPLTREFGAREVVRGVACFVAMFPPAAVIGALYPVAMECVGRAHPHAPVAALGRAAALNTVGNIAGVLVAGFWMLPAMGALRSIQSLALLCLVVGIAVIACAGLSRRALAWAPAALVVALLACQPRSFDYTALASGANVYFGAQNFGRVIDHAESVDGGLTTVAMPGKPGLRVLLTNGKFQGTDDLRGEGVAQAGIALSALLHTGARERALVVGYGTGMTARVLHDAGFRAIDIVDVSADIVRLADRHFGGVNSGVRERPGVSTFITDGRNLLLLQDRRYDLVSMEITSIWFAGAASLYNREFYQLVKRRLADEGVLQQWVQLHHIYLRDVLYILGSVRAEFRYVWLYEIGGQGVIIAGNGDAAAPRQAYVEQLANTAMLQPLHALYDGSFASLRERQLLDPEGVDRLLAGFNLPSAYWVSTDDNLILEYATPKGNVLDAEQSYARNVAAIRRAAAPTD